MFYYVTAKVIKVALAQAKQPSKRPIRLSKTKPI